MLAKPMLTHCRKSYVSDTRALWELAVKYHKKKHEMQQGELHSAVESVLGLPSRLGKGLFASVLWVVTAVCPSALGFKQK